jgi:hypothetical protein
MEQVTQGFFKSVDHINDRLLQVVRSSDWCKAGDKRRIRYERASVVGDVLSYHVSGEWNDGQGTVIT